MTTDFYPRFSYISEITLGVETVLEFTENHDFTDGELIALRVSRPYGTWQLNQKTARVLEHTDTTVTLELNSQDLPAFIYPVSGKNTPPVAVPAGSSIVPDQYTPYVNLEDSFDNRPTGGL